MPLSKEYRAFLKAQTGVKKRTLEKIGQELAVFPSIDKLNAEWFRKRVKRVSPYTIRKEILLAKRVLRFHGKETTDLDEFKRPRTQESVTVEDLYTREELDKIFRLSTETRDRAMMRVLYESACRASELLSMRIEAVNIENDGVATVIVKGKTGTREVYLKESVPALKAWLNVHPKKKGKIWVSMRSPFKPLAYVGLYQVVTKILNRAGMREKKKKVVHMFRHTRITELVRKGVRGSHLKRFAGWSKGSDMESIYVHLSTDDVKNEVKERIFGMKVTEDIEPMTEQAVTCKKCEAMNDSSDIVCTECGFPLTDDLIVRRVREAENLEKRITEELIPSFEKTFGSEIMQLVQETARQTFEQLVPQLEARLLEKMQRA